MRSSQRWTPTMPRLAVDGYWRAHVIRADRLSRALAAKSGAPAGWTWRVGIGRCRPSAIRRRRIASRNSPRGPGFCCVCGQPVYRFGWHSRPVGRRAKPPRGMAHRLRGGVAALERAERPRPDAAAFASTAMRADRRTALEDRRNRPPGAAVPRLARIPRHAVAGAAVVLGRAQPSGDQPRCARRQMRRGGEVARAKPRGANCPDLMLRSAQRARLEAWLRIGTHPSRRRFAPPRVRL